MNTMQFRDFVFLHNPKSIQISSSQEIARHFCPGFGEVAQGLGCKARVVRCEGSFFGLNYSQAMAQLQEFRDKTSDGKVGTLFVPGISPFLAQLRELVFDARGDGRIIAYTMEFIEAREV